MSERIKRLRALLRELRPNVIQAYGFPSDIYSILATYPRNGLKVVSTRRGNQESPRIRGLYRLTNRFVDRILCVSKATEEFARTTEAMPAEKSLVISNGIDMREFRSRPAPRGAIRVIGTLGRLRFVKGIDLLIDAFQKIGRDDLRLLIGGPADSQWGRDLRAAFESQKNITFCGEVEDPHGFLASLDLFVLPSRSEGMSNALLEAMGMELPIVATDVGSNREVLADGQAGVIAAPDADAIAAAILALVDDPDSAARLATLARARVEGQYSLSEMVRRYETFYEGIAG